MQTMTLCVCSVFSTTCSRWGWTPRGQAEFGDGRGSVGEQPGAEAGVDPSPGRHPGPVGRGGAAEKGVDGLVERAARDEAALFQERLEAAYPAGDQGVGVGSGHGWSSSK